MQNDQLDTMRNDPTTAIFDYQVASAERFKDVNNEMFMKGLFLLEILLDVCVVHSNTKVIMTSGNVRSNPDPVFM